MVPAGALNFVDASVSSRDGHVDMDRLIKELLVHMEEIAYAHSLAARTLGKGLASNLHDIAGVSKDSR